MKTFDRVLGNTLAVFFTLFFIFAIFYQIVGLALGDGRVGGLYGNRGNAIFYDDY